MSECDLFIKLSNLVSARVSQILALGKIPIIGGYIPGFKDGIENKIGRGYSDATASLTSVGLSDTYKVILEIQKSVSGMLSSDPRLLEEDREAKLLEFVDYITAKEITGVRGAQAKLLHSQVLRRELQEADIDIHLFNPFEDGKGTIISSKKLCKSKGVEYVGGREKVIFFSISSGRMLDPGVLFDVFGIVKNYASVDIVGTSETEISFTIDDGICRKKLQEMRREISKKLEIEIENVSFQEHKALVYCIGQNLYHDMGSLGKAASALSQGGVNIEMVSQGTKERAMVFGIDDKDYKKSINLLHDAFILK